MKKLTTKVWEILGSDVLRINVEQGKRGMSFDISSKKYTTIVSRLIRCETIDDFETIVLNNGGEHHYEPLMALSQI